MRALRYVLGPAALILLGGCATLTIVPAERLEGQRLTPAAEPIAHIYAANWGVYLFKYLPLITGSLSRPGVPSWPALFSDEVQVDLLVQKVSAESKQRGGTVLTDLRTRDRSYWLDWTLIFWLNEFEVSIKAISVDLEVNGKPSLFILLTDDPGGRNARTGRCRAPRATRISIAAPRRSSSSILTAAWRRPHRQRLSVTQEVRDANRTSQG